MQYSRKNNYRRRLPHLQTDGSIFLSFHTKEPIKLEPAARDIVFACCLYEDGKTIALRAAVVMPNHVHLAFEPLRDSSGEVFPNFKITQRIKSVSAHRINQLLRRKGSVWQEESFNRALRRSEGYGGAVEYIRQNPVAAGLVDHPDDYPWLYIKRSASPGEGARHSTK